MVSLTRASAVCRLLGPTLGKRSVRARVRAERTVRIDALTSGTVRLEHPLLSVTTPRLELPRTDESREVQE
jgi:hypothetical protein